MNEFVKGKGSIYLSTFIQRIIVLIGFLTLTLKRMEVVFPHVKEFKQALSKFDPSNKIVIDQTKKIPFKEELDDGSVKITMTRKHKEASDFLFNNFSLENYLEFMFRNSIQSIFADFDNYLTSIMKLILINRKDLLGDVILPVENLDNINSDKITKGKIAKKIHNKFYDGYEEIINGFIKKRLSLKHNVKKEDIVKIKELKLIRDIYIHSDGRANEIFLKKTNRKNFNVGTKIPLTLDTVNQLLSVTQSIAFDIDIQFVKAHPESINHEFNLQDFIKSKDELASLFSFEEVSEGVKNL